MSAKSITPAHQDRHTGRVYENLSSNQKVALVVTAIAAIVLGLLAFTLLAITQTGILQELLHHHNIILTPHQVMSITIATAIGGGLTVAFGGAIVIVLAILRREQSTQKSPPGGDLPPTINANPVPQPSPSTGNVPAVDIRPDPVPIVA